jgi:hypothetical protein
MPTCPQPPPGRALRRFAGGVHAPLYHPAPKTPCGPFKQANVITGLASRRSSSLWGQLLLEWKKDVRKEHETQGYNGRFGPGLPRVSDGSLLFLLHLISKMRPASEGGSRFGIVLNGLPLFTGGAELGTRKRP